MEQPGQITKPFTWLHVSDLHIEGKSYEEKQIREALVEAVKRERVDGWAPDFIVATGDIGKKGRPSDYASAEDFFGALLEACKLDIDRLFVVPGNHDVDRSRAFDLRRTLESAEEAGKYFCVGSSQRHFSKFDAFFDWQNKYVGKMSSKSTCGPAHLLTLGDERVAILPINTALFSAGGDDYSRLWVGMRPLADEIEKMNSLGPSLKIALMHHPLSWLHHAERSQVQRKIRRNFDIIMSGHLHDQEVENVVSGHGEAIHVAAGAAYQGTSWPNRILYGRFLVYKDRAARRAIELYPLRFESDPGEWLVDPSLFPNERKTHRKQFFLHQETEESNELIESVVGSSNDFSGTGEYVLSNFIDGLVEGGPDEERELGPILLKIGRVLSEHADYDGLLSALTGAHKQVEVQGPDLAVPVGRKDARRILREQEVHIRSHARRAEKKWRTEGAEPLVEALDVTKQLGESFVLEAVSLAVRRGQILAIVGHNGSGKTTLLRCLAHDLSPSNGEIRNPGLVRQRPGVLRQVGYIPQQISPWSGTLREHLLLTLAFHGFSTDRRSKIDSIAHEHRVYSLLDRHWSQLSEGEKTRCSLAEHVMLEPSVLILDEPLAALDPIEIPLFLGDLYHESRLSNKAVILSTQNVLDVEPFVTHVLVLREGKMLFYGPSRSIADRYSTRVWRLDCRDDTSNIIDAVRPLLPQNCDLVQGSSRHIWIEADKAQSSSFVLDAVVRSGVQESIISVHDLTDSSLRVMHDSEVRPEVEIGNVSQKLRKSQPQNE